MGRLPRKPASPACAEGRRQLKGAVVAIQMDHIPGAIEHRCAVLAFLEMSLHGGAQLRVRFAFQIIRDFLPYLLATDYHGLFPFPNGVRPNQPSAKAGARM